MDNLVEGLAKAGVKPLRVGSQGNIRSTLISHSLEYKQQMHPLYPAFQEVIKEVEDLVKESRKLAVRYAKTRAAIEESRRLEKEPPKRLITTAENMFKDLEVKKLRIKAIRRKKYAIEQVMVRDVVADADVVRFLVFMFIQR